MDNIIYWRRHLIRERMMGLNNGRTEEGVIYPFSSTDLDLLKTWSREVVLRTDQISRTTHRRNTELLKALAFTTIYGKEHNCTKKPPARLLSSHPQQKTSNKRHKVLHKPRSKPWVVTSRILTRTRSSCVLYMCSHSSG
jgi:hypothetical protein